MYFIFLEKNNQTGLQICFWDIIHPFICVFFSKKISIFRLKSTKFFQIWFQYVFFLFHNFLLKNNFLDWPSMSSCKRMFPTFELFYLHSYYFYLISFYQVNLQSHKLIISLRGQIFFWTVYKTIETRVKISQVLFFKNRNTESLKQK